MAYDFESCDSMQTHDSLARFLTAQEKQYATAFAEIGHGRKRSHWMWYIFPQIAGLGFSDTSRFYAIRDLAEAQAYLQHPVLGDRLIRISQTLLTLPGTNAHQIFGSPDEMKLRSSMTLFAALPQTDPVFQSVLDKYFGGHADPATLRLIKQNDENRLA